MEELLNLTTVAENLKHFIALYGLKVIAAVAILIGGRIASGFIRSILKRILMKSKVEQTLITFIINLTYTLLIAFFIIAALGKLGVQTTSFIAIIGAAGLAVGLALQGSLSNFAAGVLMIIFKPFKVGDFIEGAGSTGVVEGIGIFTTELKTPDNKLVIIPNSKITGDNIVNYSAKDTRRVDIIAGVSYSDDLGKVKNVIKKILEEESRILKDPAPVIAVLELAESSVNFVVRPWVKTENYWDVFFSLQEKIKIRFDEEGITIPFPQKDIHLFQEKVE
jgi:small conductance mechanosensitive channel